MSHDELKRRCAEAREKVEATSEPTELLPLAQVLYDAFRERDGLRWMPPFEKMSLVRRENWMRVARAAIADRWSAFSVEELRALHQHLLGQFYYNWPLDQIEAELARRAAKGGR